ncbi:hypothetical protein HN935_00945 [archaeon]|jgi:hypothetical protein|nr:hypothetical protein [archaeon]
MVNKKVGSLSPLRFSRDRSQKKAVWRGYILALILGLIVLSLSIYFLFFEYFTSDELDWQECRQSVVLRANSPDLFELGTDMKGLFPLKCRTEVVTFDSADPDEIYEKISKAVASGWYMFGRGEFDFVHKGFNATTSYCVVFARLHYTAKASAEHYEGSGFTREQIEKKREEVSKKKVSSLKGPDHDFMLGFNIRFIEYYKTHDVPGSKGTYDDYLPLWTNETSGIQHFEIQDDLSPVGDDTLLVYKIRAVSGLSGSYLGSASTGGIIGAGAVVAAGVIFAPLTLGASLAVIGAGAAGAATLDWNFWGNEAAAKEAIKEANRQRKIIAVAPDYLKTIGCDEYLAIPA